MAERLRKTSRSVKKRPCKLEENLSPSVGFHPSTTIHCFKQNPCRLVDLHRQRLLERYPFELPSFVVENHLRFPRAARRIIQQHKMRVPIKLARMDAVLHEHELDVREVQPCFLFDLASQCRFRSFSPLRLAAGDAPR